MQLGHVSVSDSVCFSKVFIFSLEENEKTTHDFCNIIVFMQLSVN